MAASTDFNYADLLSFDKARLVKRNRLNFLGTKQLVFEYTGISGAAREEAILWLEDNRLTIVDPKFGFRTYAGTWKCVSIEYVEANAVVRQTFRIDSSLVNDVAQRSSYGVEAYRSYYFRVVDPSAYNIPESAETGVSYAKRVQDNGDGTYDVVIEKSTETNKSSNGSVSAATYTETTTITTQTDVLKFATAGGTIADATFGQIKRIDNVPLDNGKYRSTVTTRTSIPYRYPADYVIEIADTHYLSWYSDWDVSQPNYYILGKNQPIANFNRDQGLLPNTCVRTHSFSINDDGSCDYIINGFV